MKRQMKRLLEYWQRKCSEDARDPFENGFLGLSAPMRLITFRVSGVDAASNVRDSRSSGFCLRADDGSGIGLGDRIWKAMTTRTWVDAGALW